jgi:protein TonB
MKLPRIFFTALILLLGGCESATQMHPPQELDRAPKATFLPPPQYPFELHKAGVTGHAVVEFVVNTAGETTDVHAVSATHPLFAAAAVAAVRRAKFVPGYRGGRAVFTRLQVPLYFTLEDQKPAPAH